MIRIRYGLCGLLWLYASLSWSELAPEPIPNIETLPDPYPPQWVFAHDTNFRALFEGKVVVVDVGAPNHHVKGMLGASQFATFAESKRRRELYVGETFYSRGYVGERTDVISIYDKSTLARTGELVLPGGKRGQTVTEKNAMVLVDNERYLLLFNFTPAASVLVVDIDKRSILNDIPIPGCSLIYPTGRRGFSSFCGNGGLVSFQLDEAGQIAEKHRLPAFIDIDSDPLFEKNGRVGDRAYYPSFQGYVQEIDYSAARPALGRKWSLTSAEERARQWRPGGWQIVAADEAGLLYVLMHRDGYEGSHKDGGAEVWVFDTAKRQRLNRIALQTWGVSIEVTHGAQPLLVVTNAQMQLDVYDATSGDHVRMIGDIARMPLVLHAVK